MLANKVSVVIPNYNNQEYLPICIDSILGQTHSNIEIIIVDDASTDNSLDVLEKYTRNHENIIVMQNETNSGVATTRHNGILKSTGKYITTLDSDDYLIRADKIEKEVDLMLKYENMGQPNVIAYSNIKLVYADGTIKDNNKPVCENITIEDILTRECMIPRDFLFTAKQYEEIGGHDLGLGLYEDWDFKIRLAVNNKYVYTGIDGIAYVQHNTGLSSSDMAFQAKWAKHVLEKNLHHADISQHDEIRKIIHTKFVGPMINNNIIARIFRKLKSILRKCISVVK